MASADVDMDIRAEDHFGQHGPQGAPVLQYYQAKEMIQDKKRPLYELMKKEPAVLGSLQIVSGILNVGIGILFAVALEINKSFITLFRVSQLTGVMFIFSGLVSNLLHKYPALLSGSIAVNCGCIVASVVGACLISVDLALKNHTEVTDKEELKRMALLELCVLSLEVFLSAALCFWFTKEKRANSP